MGTGSAGMRMMMMIAHGGGGLRTDPCLFHMPWMGPPSVNSEEIQDRNENNSLKLDEKPCTLAYGI